MHLAGRNRSVRLTVSIEYLVLRRMRNSNYLWRVLVTVISPIKGQKLHADGLHDEQRVRVARGSPFWEQTIGDSPMFICHNGL